MPFLPILLLALVAPPQADAPAPRAPADPSEPATARPAAVLPDVVSLASGWSVVGLDADGGSLLAGRIDLPLVQTDGVARLQFERDLGLSGPAREGHAVLRLEGARQVERVTLDGEPLAGRGRAERTYALGRALADGRPHRLVVEVASRGDEPVGLWGEASLELLPDAGLARPFEAGVGPPAEWTWLDPATPELVVRAELVARDGRDHELALEARLRNAAGLELAAELATGVAVAADRPGVVGLRLRPRSLAPWSPRDAGPVRLELRVLEAGRPVDALTVDAPAHRLERLEDGSVLDRARGRRLPLFVYRPSLRAGAVQLGDAARARDLARLASVGAVAVEARGPFDGVVEGGDRDLERAAWESGLWLAPVGEDVGAVELPAVGRGDGEAALADHARAVAEALARGDGRFETFDADPRGPGLFDGYRRPKFAYHAARAAAGEPTVYPATFWNAGGGVGPLDVYSSGDAVELFLDGVSLGTRPVGTPDAPPFAARFPAVERGAGELRAVAYAGGSVVAERTLGAPAPPTRLVLSPDLLGVALGLPDVCVVHALAVDEAGHLQAGFEGPVRFTLFGGLDALGPTEVRAEAGVASLLLRATSGGAATLAAASEGLRATPLVLSPTAPR